MAQLNVNGSSVAGLIGVKPLMRLDGGSPAVFNFPELGSETFLTGEMVCLSGSAGNAVGITKPGTDASGYGILGFAADNASGYTSSFKGVYIASPDTIFIGNIGHSVTAASAQTAPTDIGQLYGLTSLSGRTYVDKYKTTFSTVMCRVLGLTDDDVVPSFYGKAKFVVLGNKLQTYNNLHIDVSSYPTALIL